MMLKVYADETGTHDGSDLVVLTGLIESREYWHKFNGQWNSVLNNYSAKFFHYREFREAANKSPEDPYFGWSDEKRRNFLVRLAMLVGESAVPTGGAYAIARNTKLGIKKNPFDEAIGSFFGSTIAMLEKHWPDYAGKLLFVFDKTKNRDWLASLYAIHGELKKNDSRIGNITFEDDKDPSHLALQAADFSGMHFRNAARQYVETEGREIDVRIIDFLVHKNQDVSFRHLSKEKTKKLIEDMRGHEARVRSKEFTGAYFPLRDFPFKEFGYQR